MHVSRNWLLRPVITVGVSLATIALTSLHSQAGMITAANGTFSGASNGDGNGGGGNANGEDGDLRTYGDGPVTGDDFKQTPPPLDERSKDNDGQPVKAEIAVGIDVQHTTNSAWKENADGSVTIETTADPQASSFVDRDKSWADPDVKDDPGLLDHEQGHLDVAEQHARDLQAELNRKKESGELTERTTLDPGWTEQDIDDAINQQQESVQKKIDDEWGKSQDAQEAANERYDQETNHGKEGELQKAAREAQRKALEAPNKDENRKKGPEAVSRTTESIRFDSLTGSLIIDNDFIVGVAHVGSFVIDPNDPILGAEVILPEFTLAGIGSMDRYFFSAVAADSELVIFDGVSPLFSTRLAYLLYDPEVNLFYGVGGRFDASVGSSRFVDALVNELSSGLPSLVGFEFAPDVDFYSATAGFTASASSAGTNSIGARSLDVPEPSSLVLFASGTIILLGYRCGGRRKPFALRHHLDRERLAGHATIDIASQEELPLA